MDRRPSSRRSATAAAATLLASLLFSLIPAAQAQANDSKTTEVAPGVTYQTIYEKNIKSHVFILRFDPSKGASLRAVPAGNQLPSQSPTVKMLEGVHAVAGINGDLLNRPRHSPAQAFATDGDLLQTRTDGNVDRLLGITPSGITPRVGKTAVEITLDDSASGTTWPIDVWNPGRDPGASLSPRQVAGYTSYGGSVATPPSDACSARLTNRSATHWADEKHGGVARTWTVNEIKCAKAPMPLNGDDMVLAAPRAGSGAAQIKGLSKGSTVSVTWSLEGWHHITGAIGGNRLILSHGSPTVGPKCKTYLCSRDARTGIGIADDGTVMLVVVDDVANSRGVTLYQFAKLLQQLGAKDALNLDGDGSSTMWVKGKTMNEPGDPGRYVSSALAILKGPDPDVNILPPTTPDAPSAGTPSEPVIGELLAKGWATGLVTVKGILAATTSHLPGGSN